MTSSSPIASGVLQAQEQFWRALQARDAAALRRVLAPSFVGRSPGEADQDRDAFVATLLAFPGAISEIAGEEIAVHDWGGVAVLTGVQVAVLRMPDGREINSRVMLSNVFVLEGSDWQMGLSYALELRESRSE